jgi:hypothetical protein
MTDPATGTSVSICVKKTVILADNGTMRTINITNPAANTAILIPLRTGNYAITGLKRLGSACLYSYAL